MTDGKKIKHFESVLYLIFLAIALLIPFLTPNHFEGKDWNMVIRGWLHLIPFLFVFLACNYLLAPKFLLKRKYVSYMVLCVILIATVMIADYALFSLERRGCAPKITQLEQDSLCHSSSHHSITYTEGDKRRSPHEFSQDRPPMKPGKYAPPPPFINFGAIIIYFLLIGFISGIKILVWWNEEKNAQAEKEKQLLNAELAYLRHQISPHFFMNTLNNIHALVDIDGERAKEAIIKLSRLMRYLLYESDLNKTSLTKEIEFIESYIELMRLRYDEKQLKIRMNYPENIKKFHIPPFLFISFVENAFKHGVNIKTQSLIEITLQLIGNRLTLHIRNSKHPCTTEKNRNENTGIGLENIKKRLQLIYNTDYAFSIEEDDGWYQITLDIPAL